MAGDEDLAERLGGVSLRGGSIFQAMSALFLFATEVEGRTYRSHFHSPGVAAD